MEKKHKKMKIQTKIERLKEKELSIWKTPWVFGSIELEGGKEKWHIKR